MSGPKVVVFDVNETLLDLSGLDPAFTRVFGEAEARREWFEGMLREAFVTVITDRHSDFGTIARAVLDSVAAIRGVGLSPRDREEILEGMRVLPAYPDVIPALDRLRAAGLRIGALTNSPQEAANAQLRFAGLYDRFEMVLSVEHAGRLKPHPDVYRMAAERLGASPGGIRMGAAHAWDVTGAMRAGCAAAFVARPGKVLSSLDEHPDIVGPDLETVARRIVEVELEPTDH